MNSVRSTSVPKKATTSPGRPKDSKKRTAILEAATQMFLTHGYDGISMDQIAAEAKVSKLTLYSHFGDKENLFIEAANAYCTNAIPTDLMQPEPGMPMREQLVMIARHFFEFTTNPQAIAAIRMMSSPHMLSLGIAEKFWATGPCVLQRTLADLLENCDRQQLLKIDDSFVAAGHFFSLVIGDFQIELLLGCVQPPSEAILETHIQSAVDVFMRAYQSR